MAFDGIVLGRRFTPRSIRGQVADRKVGMFVLQNNEDSAVYVMRERKAIAWAESVNRSLALDWRVKNAKVRSQVAVMIRSIFFFGSPLVSAGGFLPGRQRSNPMWPGRKALYSENNAKGSWRLHTKSSQVGLRQILVA